MLGAAPTVEMEITRTACAGAATAFLLRKLGKNAGAYSPATPGIVDRVLFELGTQSQGSDLARVARWFAERAGELARLGHRYGARLVAFRTGTILDWVAGGQGHRGAVLVTSGELLYPGSGISAPHALAIAWDPRMRGRGRDALVGVDPWPGIGRIAPLPMTLENAHRRCLNRAAWSLRTPRPRAPALRGLREGCRCYADRQRDDERSPHPTIPSRRLHRGSPLGPRP